VECLATVVIKIGAENQNGREKCTERQQKREWLEGGRKEGERRGGKEGRKEGVYCAPRRKTPTSNTFILTHASCLTNI